MKTFKQKRVVSLSVIIAMIANPALSQQQRAAEIEVSKAMQKRLVAERRASTVKVEKASTDKNISVDQSAPENYQSRLKESSNGTTVVDIAEVSDAGVSHNKYTQFNVDENGLILNNSAAPVLTKLGGWADGNRNLAGGLANIILSEVTGASRSQLNGHIEVAGQAAEFVLANQNGITCNGCGFINIPKATMVTGSPRMNDSGIAGFSIGAGDVVIGSGGLDASAVDRFDIVTRAASVNGSIHANNLNIKTGNDYYDYVGGDVSSSSDHQGERKFSLDVSALGGMYANSIHLVGTESGLGVNSEGLIQSVNDLQLTADGTIQVKNAVANQSISMESSSEDVITNGQIYAPSVQLASSASVINEGMLASREALTVQAESFSQQGQVYVGMTEGGSMLPAGSLDFGEVNHLENSGLIYSPENLDLNVESLRNENGSIVSPGNISLNARESLDNQSGIIRSQSGSVALSSEAINNQGGQVYTGQESDLSIDWSGVLDNTGGTLLGGQLVTIESLDGDLVNNEGVIKSGRVEVSAGSIANRSGYIEASDLIIDAGSVDNAGGTFLAAGSEGDGLTVAVENDLNNTGGTMHSSGGSLIVDSARLNNAGGNISAGVGSSAIVTVEKDIDNDSGQISAGTVNINASSLGNTEGVISSDVFSAQVETIGNNRGTIQAQNLAIDSSRYESAGGTLLAYGDQAELSLDIDDVLVNSNGARIQSEGQGTHLSARYLINNDADILHYGNGSLRLSSYSLDNRSGSISGSGAIDLDAVRVDNNSGIINAQEILFDGRTLLNNGGRVTASRLSISAGQAENRGGQLSASDSLALSVNSLNNHDGEVYGANSVSLSVLSQDGLENRDGTIYSGQSLMVEAGGLLANHGAIHSEGALNLGVGRFVNNGQVVSERLNINAASIANNNSALIEAQSLSVQSGRFANAGSVVSYGSGNNGFGLDVSAFDNSGILEVYAENLNLLETDYSNNGGSIIHHGAGRLSLATGDALDNRNGVLRTSGSLSVNASSIDNRDGEISAARTLGLSVEQFNNQGGLLSSGGSVNLSLSSLNNSGGRVHLFSDDDSTVTVNQTLDSSGGEIVSYGEGGLAISAGVLDNTEGHISGNGNVSVTLDSLINESGALGSASALVLEADDIANADGQISGETVELATTAFENLGTVSATSEDNDALEFYAQELVNRGLIESYGYDLDLGGVQVDNADGRLVHRGSGTLTLIQDTFDNTQGQVYTGGDLSITAGMVDNTRGEILAQSNATLESSQSIVNSSGLLQAQSGITIVTDSLTNDVDGEIVGLGGQMTLEAGSLDNSASIEAAGNITALSDTINNSGYLNGSEVRIESGEVRNSGLVSSTSLTLDAVNIVNSSVGEIQSGDIQVSALSVENAGVVVGHGEDFSGVSLVAEELVNTGRIESQGQSLELGLQRLDNTGGLILYSGQSEGLSVDSGSFHNEDGSLVSSSDLLIQSDAIANSQGEITAEGIMTLEAGQLVNADGLLSSGGDVTVDAQSFDNSAGGLLVAQGSMAVSANNFVNNEGRVAASSIVLSSQEFTNQLGNISADNFSLTVGDFDNTDGFLLATADDGANLLSADGSVNNAGGIIQSQGGDLTLTSGGVVNSQSGQIALTGDGDLSISADSIDNLDSALISGGPNVDVLASGNILNQGYVQSDANLTLGAGTLNNANGRIKSGEKVTIDSGNLVNTSDSEEVFGWISADWVEITVDQFVNDQHSRVEASQLSVTASELDNNGLILAADDVSSDLSIESQTISNIGRIESHNGNATVSATSLSNAGIIVQSAGDSLTVAADNLTNTGSLTGDGNISIVSDGMLNNQGSISGASAQELNLSAGTLENQEGLITGSILSIDAQQLNNRSGEINAQQLSIVAQDLLNEGATIVSEDLDVESENIINQATEQSDGYISADRADLGSQTLNNSGTIQGENLTLTSDTVENREGVILSTGENDQSLILDAASVDNSLGLIESHGTDFSFEGSLVNNQGSVLHTGDGVAAFSGVDNTEGVVATSGAMQITADDVINAGGLIQVGKDTRITAQRLDNESGSIVTSEDIALSVNAVSNTDGGLVLSQSEEADAFSWSGTEWTNEGGTLEIHSTDQTLRFEGFDNQGGTLSHVGSGTMLLRSDSDLMTGDGVIVSEGRIDFETAGTLVNSGVVSANESVVIRADAAENTIGSMIESMWLSIDASYATNFGTIHADNLSLRSGTLVNQATEDESGEFSGGVLVVSSDQDDAFALNGNKLENKAGSRVQLHSNNSHLDGEVVNSGQLAALGGGQLRFNNLSNHNGTVISHGDISIEQEHLDNRQGELRADGRFESTTQSFSNAQGLVQSGAGLSITDGQFDNTEGTLLSQGEVSVVVEQSIDNTGGSIVNLADDITLSAGSLVNTQGAIEHRGSDNLVISDADSVSNIGGQITSAGSLAINTDELLNNAFVVEGQTDHQGVLSAAAVSLTADSLDNEGGYVQGDQSLQLLISDVDNSGGAIVSAGSGAGSFVLQSDALDNSEGGYLEVSQTNLSLINVLTGNAGGTIKHRGSGLLELSVAGDLDNSSGAIHSLGDLGLDAQSVANVDGTIVGRHVSVRANSTIDNTQGGYIAGDTILLSSDRVDNSDEGMIASQGEGEATLELDVGEFVNHYGTVKNSSTDWRFDFGEIDNTNGTIIHTGSGLFSLHNPGTLTITGTVASTSDIDVMAQQLNSSGNLLADGGLSLNVEGDLTNADEAVIRAGEALSIDTAGDIDNAGGITALNGFDLTANGELDNSGVIVTDSHDASVTTGRFVNSGRFAHNGQGVFSLQASELVNGTQVGAEESAVRLKSAGTLDADGVELSNAGIISAQTLEWTGFDTLVNQALGHIEATNITFSGDTVDNAGQLAASGQNGSLVLAVSDLNNQDSAKIETNSHDMAFQGDVTNAGSIVHAGTGVLRLGNAGSVNVQGGSVHTAGTAQLSGSIAGAGNISAEQRIHITGVGTFTNSASTLYSLGNIDIDAAVNNRQGTMIADGVLDIDTSGTVENRNGLLQGGEVRVNADRLNNTGGGQVLSTAGSSGYVSVSELNNQGGTIASRNTSFSVSATDLLDNTSGSILHKGSGRLDVSGGASIDNAGGSLQSIGTLYLRDGPINNNSGGLLSGATVDISTGELTNGVGSRIVATGQGDSRIDVTTLTNSGTLSALTGEFDLDVAGTFDNTSGSLVFAGNTGVLQVTLSDYVSNTDSKIRSNAAMDLQTTGYLENAGEISAGQLLSIYAGSLTNQASGRLDSGNILSIDTQGGTFNNEGTVNAQGILSADTSTLINNGTLASDGAVRLKMDALSFGEGEIEAKGLLDIDVTQSLTLNSDDTLESEGNLYLRTQGDLNNAGNIMAEGAVWLEGSTLTNSATGQIAGGAMIENGLYPDAVDRPVSSSLSFAGSIDNSGSIKGESGLILESDQVTNTGDIVSGNYLSLISNSLSNGAGGVIFSNGGMHLGVSGSIQNDNADIVSLAAMEIDGGNGASVGELVNTNARIESFGNMRIKASSIKNITEGVELVEGERTVEDEVLQVGGGGYLGGLSEAEVVEGPTPSPSRDWANDVFSAEKIERTTIQHYDAENTANTRDAVISSGGNLTVEDASFTNAYGTINVSGDFYWSGRSYESLGSFAEKEVKIVDEYYWGHDGCQYYDERLCTFAVYEYEPETSTINGGSVYGGINVGGDVVGELDENFVLKSDHYNGGGDGSRNVNVNVSYSGVDNAGDVSGESAPVDMPGGGDGDGEPSDTVTNQYAGYLSGRDGSYDQGGASGSVNDLDKPEVDQMAVPGDEDYQALGLTPGQDVERQSAGEDFLETQLANIIARYVPEPEVSETGDMQGASAGVDGEAAQQQALNDGETAPVDPSEATGGGDVSGHDSQPDGADEILPAGDEDQLADFKERAAERGKEVVLTAGGQYVMVDPQGPASTNQQGPTGVEIDTLPDNYNPDTLGGLYVENSSPDSQYLVETRSEFTDYGNFLGSGYLLAAIGYNPDKTHKRLGDAFYENQIIRDALMDQGTTRYLGDNTSDYEQMQTLMDNAIAADQSMELAVGVSLTPEQAANLTEDIVWMVEEEVEGESVLVPRLYLASMSEDDLLASNSAMRVGGDINLSVGGDLTFGNNVSARGDMAFSAGGDIAQNADLDSMQGLWLDAGGDLTNNGTLTADLLELTAGGDITNAGSLTADRGLWLDSQQSILNQSVGDMVSDGVLSLSATEDITNAQGYIEGRDVSFVAEQGDIINRTEFEQHDIRGYGLGTWTSVGEDSVIVSHDSLMMDAGNNIDLQGSSLASDGTISLSAGNDVLMGAVERKFAYESAQGRRSYENTTYQVVDIDAGEHLLINAGRDIVGEGSQLNAGGSALLDAGRDISLEAVANVDHSHFAKKDYERTTTVIEHTQANLTAEGDVSAHAGQDINLVGANVISENGNIRLHGERDTNLLAVKDSEYEYSYERDDKSFGRSETHISESMQETLAGGVLQAGGSVLINTEEGAEGLVTLDSENINMAGATVGAGQHVLVGAGSDINIAGMNTAELDYEESKSSGLGGFSSSATGEVTEGQRWNSALVDAGGSVVMDSGNNLAMKGTNVRAAEDIELEALDQVLITHGTQNNNTESWDKSSGLFTGGDLYASHESRAGETTGTAVGSALQADGAVIVDSGRTKIVGSDIHGEQGVQISADLENVEVLAAANTTESFSFEEHKTVGMGDLIEGLGDPEGPVKNQDGRLTVTIADATYDRVETQTQIKDMTGSTITSGEDLVIDAANDIEVVGSTLAAGVGESEEAQETVGDAAAVAAGGASASPQYQAGAGQPQPQAEPGDGSDEAQNNVVLSAGNNVTIKEATNTYESETKEVHGKAELSVVVQHQAAEVAKAAIAVKDARDKLKQAKKDLEEYENNLKKLKNNLAQMEADYEADKPGVNYNDLLEMRELVDDVEGDEEWYEGGVGMAAANLTAKTTALVQQSAAAAQSTGTYGFNAGVQLDIDASKSKESVKETTSLASNVSGENIHIQTGVGQDSAAGTTTTIQGSHLQAEQGLTIDTGSLDVLASRDTLEVDTQSEQAHITAQMTVYGASGGASLSGDYSRSKSGEKHTTYNNSTLRADTMHLVTTDDATMRGANVHANSELTADIGGDLTVESVQNRSRTQNNSMGVSAGLSLGGSGDVSGANGGLNAANGMSMTRETVRSSLTSGGTADITVGGTTQVTGATLATVDEEGNDLGNMNLTTSELNFTDLRDTHTSSQTSGSISTSVSLNGTSDAEAETGPKTARNADGDLMDVNTTNIGYSNSSEYDAANSLATLGHGTITVDGEVLEENGELTDAGSAEGSALTGVNRDTANTTKELWSVDRQQGDIDLQVDHRFFSEEGRQSIKNDFVDTKEFGEDIGHSAQAVNDSENLGVTDFWKTLDNTAKGTQIKNALIRDPGNAEIREGLASENSDQYAVAMQQLAHLAQDKFGVSLTELNLYDGEQTTNANLQDTPLADIKGGAVMEEGYGNLGDIFVDATDGDGKKDMVDTLGHELIESVTALTGAANDAAQEDQATAFGSHFAGRVDQAFEDGLDSTATGTFNNNMVNSDAVHSGTLTANAASGVEIDNRQLMTEERRAIVEWAPVMAEREGISEREAERRMADELVGHLDASWQDAQASENRERDDVALDHLGEALAEQGELYDVGRLSDVPLPPGEQVEQTYTPEEVEGLLQDYSDNHSDSFNDRTREGEGLAVGLGEQADFYHRNFGRQRTLSDSFEQQVGEVAGLVDVGGDMVQGVVNLAKNPVDGAEAIAEGTVRPFVDPFGFVGDLGDNRRESNINVALDQLQGDYYSAGRESASGNAEELLELSGIIPLPASRASALRHLDDTPSGTASRHVDDAPSGAEPPLLLEHNPGVPAGQEIALSNPNKLLENAPSNTNGSGRSVASGEELDVNQEVGVLRKIGSKQRENYDLPVAGGIPESGIAVSNNTARTMLKKRGATSDQSRQVVESFDGQIIATLGRKGSQFDITESAPGEASGAFVTRGPAGRTSEERRENLALPDSNTAEFEGRLELNRDQVLLEGTVASQSDNLGFPDTATGGGRQVFTDAHNGGVSRVDTGPSAEAPVGRGGQQTNFPNPNAPKPRNQGSEIKGITFSGHAVDQMQARGYTPTVVENVVKHGNKTKGNQPNTAVFTDSVNKVRVIINTDTGRVVTVTGGK